MGAVERADVLVLGGGPAGIQGSRMIKGARPEWRVLMLRPEAASMVYCAIPYALEGLIPSAKALKKDELVTGAGVELVREKAVEVDLAARVVTTGEGRSIEYGNILIATGADPILPPVPGSHLERVAAVKSEQDMNRLLGFLEEGARRAVVVGAGAIGIEQALAYHKRGLEVHLVDLQERVLPHLLDADMAAPAATALEKVGIHLHLGARLERLTGNRAVAGVELAGGTKLELEEGKDFLVFAVGMKAKTDLFRDQLEIAPEGIVVDARMATGIPRTWAAGDCTQAVSGIDGKPLGGKLATNAVPQAKVAARNILGDPVSYPGIYNGAATVVEDLRFAGTGFTESYARTRGFEPVAAFGESTSRFPMMPGARPVRIKLVADAATGRLIGGQAWGHEAVAERIDVITLAIQQELKVADLARFSYSSQPWQTFFPAKNAIVEAAERLATGFDH